MENLSPEPPALYLSPAALAHLRSMRRWTKFLSILGFIFLTVMIIITSLVILQFGYLRNMLWMQALPLAVICVIYFSPFYYLWQFSAWSKHALAHANSTSLERALRYLKLHYTFLGICILVMIAIYAAIGASLVAFNNVLNRF